MLIVLGSGGHTAEMVILLEDMNKQLGEFNKRTWIVSEGDGFSAGRAAELEDYIKEEGAASGTVKKQSEDMDIITIPRARQIHQSLFTTPVSSLRCLWACLALLRRNPPDIVLTNGPGTGVILVLASLVLRFFNFAMSHEVSSTRIIYIESLARIRRLSLSGRLLSRVVDRFLVQWEELSAFGEFRGTLVLDAVKNAGTGNAASEVREPRLKVRI